MPPLMNSCRENGDCNNSKTYYSPLPPYVLLGMPSPAVVLAHLRHPRRSWWYMLGHWVCLKDLVDC